MSNIPSRFGSAFESTMGKSVALSIMGAVLLAVVSFAYAMHLKVSQLEADYGREIQSLKAELKRSDEQLSIAQKEIRAEQESRKRLEQEAAANQRELFSLKSASEQNQILLEQNKDLQLKAQAQLSTDEIQREKGMTAEKLVARISHAFVVQKMKGGGVSFSDSHPVWNVIVNFNSSQKQTDYESGNRLTVYPSECSVEQIADGNLKLNIK
jgi:hypothetical protein